MSEKQVLPPSERIERTVKCDVCGWYTPGVPQSESWALHETIATLRSELARERERHQEMRKSVLMEALKAVESERLECHENKLGYYHEPDEEDGDLAYSQAINVAEEAIKLLLAPAPVATGEN